MSSNEEILKQIKGFFEEEVLKKQDILKEFSDDVINTAYQKVSENLKDLIMEEEDPLVVTEMLNNYLSLTKMVEERGLPRQQFLLKLFEQLNKYEQSRYY